MQWKNHVHLHPIDVSYEELKKIHNDGDMNPALLDNKELRRDVMGGYYKMMTKIAETSNQNLVRPSDAYLSSSGKVHPDNEFTFCYVSKYFRTLVLKNFCKHYDISTEFCAIKYWTNRIEENVFGLTQSIHNINEAFDFEEIYDKLIKKFCHMSLFLVCLHFFKMSKIL